MSVLRRDGIALEGATSRTIVARDPGVSIATIATSEGCRATSAPVAVAIGAVEEGDAPAARPAVVVSECCSARVVLAAELTALVDLFDNAGRQVARLVDGWLASGEYVVEWSDRALGSGTYWLSVRAEGDVVVE